MNILLTGGSRGLGLAIAQQQLELGNFVFIVNRSISPELNELLVRHSEHAAFIECDLAQPEKLKESIFDQHFSNSIPIHGFVNNAAIAYDDLISNLDLGPLETMFRVNVFSPMALTKYVVRNMLLHRTAGSIVHVSSICSRKGYKGLAMYAATKGAIEAFSKNLAREWGSMGIRSNCVVPGFMETSMSASLTETQREKLNSRTSLKSATSILSVVATVEFLLSEVSCSVTGQEFVVDSGTI
ncbi:MAG TPA: SDR family oxidoreductase [Pirellula sp.]|nr:SDR family oxidoreductase [Pirellula sp.]